MTSTSPAMCHLDHRLGGRVIIIAALIPDKSCSGGGGIQKDNFLESSGLSTGHHRDLPRTMFRGQAEPARE